MMSRTAVQTGTARARSRAAPSRMEPMTNRGANANITESRGALEAASANTAPAVAGSVRTRPPMTSVIKTSPAPSAVMPTPASTAPAVARAAPLVRTSPRMPVSAGRTRKAPAAVVRPPITPMV